MIKQTLYFGSPSYLRIKHKQLVIERYVSEDQKEVHTRPIEDIGVILLDHSQITITHNVMKAMLDNKVAIISCNEQHMPSGLMLTMEGHSEQSARYRHQIDASLPLKKNLWQQTIEAKVRNQMEVLLHTNREYKRLEVLKNRVNSGDNTNVEGQAAAFYWPELFGEEFYRDRYGEFPNSLLNYGYSILRSMVARALVSSGFNLTMGIHHKNKYNAFCLADDIMEPYRPFIDLLVFEMWEENKFADDFISKEHKRRLLSIGTVDAYFGKRKRPLMVGLSSTTSSLMDCFMGKRRRIIYPKINY